MSAPPRLAACLTSGRVVTAVTAALLILGAMTPSGLPGGLLLAAAAAALVGVLTWTGHTGHAGTVRRVLARPGGASGHADAPTAYWCAVPVTHRPQRPRAPGRR